MSFDTVAKYLRGSVLLLFLLVCTVAQAISVSVSPRRAYVGAQVEVTYSVSGSASGDIRLVGKFPRGLKLLGGPVRSSNESVSIINGAMQRSSSTTFTYYISCSRAGRFTIPAAEVDGKKSHTTTLTVDDDQSGVGQGDDDDDDPWAQMDRMQQQMQQQLQRSLGAVDRIQRSAPDAKTNNEVRAPKGNRSFLYVTANKSTAYEQEGILLTYKLYSIDQPVNLLRSLNPRFDNFQYKNIEVEGDRTLRRENVHGTVYYTTTMYKYVLFPQKSGRLVVPPLNVELETSDGFQGQRVKASSDSVVFAIRALPPRPKGFTGAVGHDFKVSATIDSKQISTNDALSYSLKVTGVGNLTLFSAPQVSWPDGFESYDPKKTDKTEVTTGGNSGDILFNYVVVPHHEGSYTIPATPFVYFDTQAKAYRTLHTTPLTVKVAKGKGGGHSTELADPDADINGIHKGSPRLKQPEDSLWGSLRYILSYPAAFLLALAGFVALRRYTRATGNETLRLQRRAARVATKRLAEADKLRKAGQREAFYDEVMRALLGFVSDKLHLSNIELTRDNVQELMLKEQVDPQLVSRFLSCLGECEFARFAPGDPTGTVRKIYDDAFQSIIELDNQLALKSKTK